jgi:signal transduction histidine kinase/CheY-like chemotaxis protein
MHLMSWNPVSEYGERMQRFWNHLRFRIVLLVVLGMLPAVGLTYYNTLDQRRLAASYSYERVGRLASEVSRDYRLMIWTTRRMMAAVASEACVRELDWNACSSFFHMCFRNRLYPFCSAIGLANLQGNLMAAAAPLPGPVSFAHCSHFQRALKTGKFSVSDFQIDRLTGTHTISFAHPVAGPDGKAQAVVVATLDRDWLNRVAAASHLPAEATVTVIDLRGTVIARLPSSKEQVGAKSRDVEIVETVLAQRDGGTEARGLDGVLKIYAFKPLSDVPGAGYVYVGIPSAVAFARANQMLSGSLVALGVALVLGLTIACTVGYLIVPRTRSVRKVVHVSSRDQTAETRSLRAQLAQAQKMGSIGMLAAGIVHDLNNVLTMVGGYAELLLRDKSEKSTEYEAIQAIHQAASRGSNLVKEILTFSRRSEYHPRALSLNEEVRQAVRLLSRTIPKMIEIELHLADDLKKIYADPGQVERALLNLAVNAKDAMPNGGKLVMETRNVLLNEEYCGAQSSLKPGPYVVLTVSDTGHGMKRESLDHIFEPFYTTKEEGDGTGLGLASVFGIVAGLGGHVACYSEPGAGTTFRIYLPATKVDEASELAEAQEIPLGGTETILMVDDEELITEWARRLLSEAGYTVLTASTGEEALEIYASKKADISLVLLDLILPGMGGERCLEKLLKMDPRARVLVISGYSGAGAVERALEGGAKGFISKPFQMKQLLQALRAHLSNGSS